WKTQSVASSTQKREIPTLLLGGNLFHSSFGGSEVLNGADPCGIPVGGARHRAGNQDHFALTLMGKQALQRVFESYFPARLRAARRRSAWNLLLIAPAILGWLGSWYGQFRVVWAFHQRLYPQHSIHDFWQEGISFVSFVLSFVMLFGPVFGSL